MQVNKVEFAKQLRCKRQGFGWTQEEIAQKVGVSKRKYTRWENPDDPIWMTVDEFYQLGAVLNIDPTNLLGRNAPNIEANKEKKLQRLFKRLNEDRVFNMFVYAAMSKSSDAISALLDYWIVEADDQARR